MKKLLLKSKDSIVLLLWLIPFISSLMLWSENLSRSVVLAILLLGWIVGYFRSINKTAFSLGYLLVVSTFNITMSLGDTDGCYKHSVFVNYLCPTLHVIDIFLVFSLLLTLYDQPKEEITKNIFTLLPLSIYSVIHIITHPNMNTFVSSVRLFLFFSLLLLSFKVIKESLMKRSKLFYFFLLALGSQVVIATLQFTLGRDMNLQLLGESNLMLGTINSSFISLSFGEFLRGYGTFPHPNILAGFALALSLISLRVFEMKDFRLWILLLLSVLAITLSLSRMHIILLIIVIAVYILWNFKNRFFSFFPLLSERFLSLTSSSTAIQERLKLFGESIRVFKEHVLLGVGQGEFVRYMSNDIRTVSNISLFQPVHNIFMLALAEHGVFGFLVLFGYIFKLFTMYKKEILFALLTLLIIVTIGMFDHYLLSLPQGLIILGLLLI